MTNVTKLMNDKSLAVYGSNVAAANILGHLFWYTVPELNITRDEIANAFDSVGVDKRHMPFPISPRDALRRASRVRVPFDEQKATHLVREVALSDGIARHIVREERIETPSGKRLEYKPLVALEITDDNPAINVNLLDYAMDPQDPCFGIVADIKARYDIARDHYDASAIRRIIYTVLRACNPISVRPSGGVQFVPQKHEATLFAVAEMFPKVAGNGKFWFLPVINAENQREMVSASLDDHVATEAAAIVADLGRVLKGRQEVTPTLTEKYVKRVQAVSAAVKEYEDLLETKAITAKSHLELAEHQLRALLLSESVSFAAPPVRQMQIAV